MTSYQSDGLSSEIFASVKSWLGFWAGLALDAGFDEACLPCSCELTSFRGANVEDFD